MDEMLDVLRACWGPDPVDFHGEFVHLDAMKVQPKPAHPIPIWVGGRSEPAYRRAVARGDGFHAIGLDPEGAARVVERVRRDRPEESFTISLRTGWDPQGMDPDLIRRERDEFEAAGIQHVVSAPWRNDRPTSWMRSMELLAGTGARPLNAEIDQLAGVAGVVDRSDCETHPALNASMSVVGAVTAAAQSTSAIAPSVVVAVVTFLIPRGLPAGQFGAL